MDFKSMSAQELVAHKASAEKSIEVLKKAGMDTALIEESLEKINEQLAKKQGFLQVNALNEVFSKMKLKPETFAAIEAALGESGKANVVLCLGATEDGTRIVGFELPAKKSSGGGAGSGTPKSKSRFEGYRYNGEEMKSAADCVDAMLADKTANPDELKRSTSDSAVRQLGKYFELFATREVGAVVAPVEVREHGSEEWSQLTIELAQEIKK